MKKIYICSVITLMWLFSNAQSYYYYQGQRIGLQENKLIRCVELKHTITHFEAEKIHDILRDYCYDTEEYTPYLNKYYIKQDEYVDFIEACLARDSIIEMNSSYYTLKETYSMYPTRTILVKTKTDIELGTVLTSLSIPYSNIVQSKYNKLEYEIHLTKDKSLYYAAQLYETGLFTYAEPDFVGIVKPTGYEENTLFFDQWAVHNQNNNMNLLPAWEITTGYSKIKVAVIDDGVDLNHSDLADNLLEGYDAVRDSTSVCCGEYENEFDGHGTCCSGIIGAANNEIGIVGIAHTSKIVPIRYGHTVKKYHRESNHDSLTLHWDWVTHSNWIIDAFNHACYEDSADILSCSFGFLSHSDALDNKLREVCENGRNGRGCIVVVSAGNTYNTSGPPSADTLGFLSKHPNVISVGSMNPCGERVVCGTSCGLSSSYNSCYGDSLDVVAPGINIPTTKVSDRYTTSFTGTSSAAPHVAGVAALVLSVNPCLTMEEVKYVIESTCTKIRSDLYDYTTNPNHPNGSWNIEVGHGLVNAYAAVQLAQQMGGYTYIKDTIVTRNVTWAGNKMIHESLVVDSLATLTIIDTVHVSSNARLIVRPGGRLVVDGGTLTGACAGEMWQGGFN